MKRVKYFSVTASTQTLVKYVNTFTKQDKKSEMFNVTAPKKCPDDHLNTFLPSFRFALSCFHSLVHLYKRRFMIRMRHSCMSGVYPLCHNEYNVHKGEKNQLGFSHNSGLIIGLIPQSLRCMRVKLSVVDHGGCLLRLPIPLRALLFRRA